AVPSASLVPCVRPLPVGWSVTNVAVNDGRSVITLGHDRTGGDAMTARLTAGCVTTRIRALASSKAEVTAAAPGILGFTPRQQLAQALEQRSGGRLQLDP
ncbi:MAG: hypothetical protein ACJ782_05270, partial [Actinomycetota bacterium]